MALALGAEQAASRLLGLLRARHLINKDRMFLCQVYWLSNECGWHAAVKATRWASRGLPPAGPHLPNKSRNNVLIVSSSPAEPTGEAGFRGPCFCTLSLWTPARLLSNLRARRVPRLLSLTILASGDSRLWLWSSPPGDTCCSTDWPEDMPLLPWWPMAVEEVTSPGPWP